MGRNYIDSKEVKALENRIYSSFFGESINKINHYKYSLVKAINYSADLSTNLEESEIAKKNKDGFFLTLKMYLDVIDNLYERIDGGFFKIQEDDDDSFYIPEL